MLHWVIGEMVSDVSAVCILVLGICDLTDVGTGIIRNLEQLNSSQRDSANSQKILIFVNFYVTACLCYLTLSFYLEFN